LKQFRLRIITQNQNKKEKAQKTADSICKKLGSVKTVEIDKYDKFDNSYRIELCGELLEDENSIYQSIELTSRLCSPWIVTLKKDEKEVELIFNENQTSKFTEPTLNTISWAYFCVEN
jgi:hypothetical protein